MGNNDKNYVKQEGAGIWLPENEKDELEGKVTAINTEGLYGVQYTIKKSDDEEVLTPSHKVLQNRMQKAKVGTQVKIVYTGVEAPKIRGQNATRIYEVYLVE